MATTTITVRRSKKYRMGLIYTDKWVLRFVSLGNDGDIVDYDCKDYEDGVEHFLANCKYYGAKIPDDLVTA